MIIQHTDLGIGALKFPWISSVSGKSTRNNGQIIPELCQLFEAWSSQARTTIINRLVITGASKSSVREELLPLLISLHNETSEVGNIDDFTISMDVGLTGDEHAALCGLPKSRKSTKELVARYNFG